MTSQTETAAKTSEEMQRIAGYRKNNLWSDLQKHLTYQLQETAEQVVAFNQRNEEDFRDATGDIRVLLDAQKASVTYSLDEDYEEIVSKLFTRLDDSEEGALKTQQKYADKGVETYIVFDERTAQYINRVKESVEGNDGEFYPKDKWLKSYKFQTPVFEMVGLIEDRPNIDKIQVVKNAGTLLFVGSEEELIEYAHQLSNKVIDIPVKEDSCLASLSQVGEDKYRATIDIDANSELLNCNILGQIKSHGVLLSKSGTDEDELKITVDNVSFDVDGEVPSFDTNGVEIVTKFEIGQFHITNIRNEVKTLTVTVDRNPLKRVIRIDLDNTDIPTEVCKHIASLIGKSHLLAGLNNAVVSKDQCLLGMFLVGDNEYLAKAIIPPYSSLKINPAASAVNFGLHDGSLSKVNDFNVHCPDNEQDAGKLDVTLSDDDSTATIANPYGYGVTVNIWYRLGE